ncbi:hypothetical protein IFR05_014045 [Cadophora sp. M221]|nr:hypothetical protein IFR05_014045 [Cadophora sp. M221]
MAIVAGVNAVAFSNDASASEDKTVRLWNPITGEQLFDLEWHSDPVRAVAFSTDSQRLASASDDKTVRLWNSLTGEHLQELKEHIHPVEGVAFSPDGALLASASGDRTIILWTEEAEEALRFLGFAGRDSALDEKIRTLGLGFLHMLESLKDPLLHATAIALVEIPGGHMNFANTPWVYQPGDIAHETEIDEDDWEGIANVAQTKLGNYVLEALIKFWQYQNAWFVLIGHKLGKTFAIVKTTDSITIISQKRRGESVTLMHGAERLFFDPQNVANEVHQVNRFVVWKKSNEMVKMHRMPESDDDERDEIDDDGQKGDEEGEEVENY